MLRLLLVFALLGSAVEGQAGLRHALVISNHQFEDGTELPGVRANAEAVNKSLEKAGFEVTFEENAGDLRRIIESYAPRCSAGGTSLFYYGGLANQFPQKKSREVVGPDNRKTKESYTVPASGIWSPKGNSPTQLEEVARWFRERSRARTNLFFFDAMSPSSRTKPGENEGLFAPELADWPSGMIWYGAAPRTTAPTQSSPLPALLEKTGITVAQLASELDGWQRTTSPLAETQPLFPQTKATVSPTPPTSPNAGDQWIDPLGLVFCYCPPGKFQMGLGESQDPQDRDSPAAATELSQGFWIQKYEFTLGDYRFIREREPDMRSQLIPHGNRPFTGMKGPNALDLGQKEIPSNYQKKKLAAPKGWTYRLPTEAEWEYACRAGSDTDFTFGGDPRKLAKFANYAEAALYREDDSLHFADRKNDDLMGLGPAPSGSYKPNAWGIHDMHGNVSEWVGDHYTPSLPGGRDPRVWMEKGTHLVVRGGAWCSTPKSCRSGYRNSTRLSHNDGNSNWRGLRLVLVRDEEK